MKAWEILESGKYGWTKGVFGKTADGFHTGGDDPNSICGCLHGILRRFYHNYTKPDGPLVKVNQVIRKRYPEFVEYVQTIPRVDICRFNDHPGTTKEMVTSVLKEADV